MTTRETRGPFWRNSFNFYTLGAAWPYCLTMSPDYDACVTGIAENFCRRTTVIPYTPDSASFSNRDRRKLLPTNDGELHFVKIR